MTIYDDKTVGANVGSSTMFSATTPAPTLYVYVLNADGRIIAKVPVSANGTWSTSVAAANYTAVLSADGTKNIGDITPSTSITSTGWGHTAQYNGMGSTDGTNDGTSASFSVPVGGTTTNINFGIYQASTTPVNFGSVMAKMLNGQLMVNWVSETETNNHHYDIELSKDGQNFTKIGSVSSKAANGNSSQPPQEMVIYYGIRIEP